MELTSSLLTPKNREKKQIAKLEVCSPFKIHHYMHVWLVCETHAKILLSDPETLLMTPCLVPLKQLPGRSHGNHQSSQLSGSCRNFWNDWGDRDDHMETRFNIYLPSNNPSLRWLLQSLTYSCILRSTQRQFSENICWEDDLRSRIFGTFVVKFLACLPLLGFSNT